MSQAEVVAFLAAYETVPDGGLPCMRFYRRADGTILTADCLVGVGRRRAPALIVAGAAGAIGVAAALGLVPDPVDADASRAKAVGSPAEDADSLSFLSEEEPELVFGAPARVDEDAYVARSLLGLGIAPERSDEPGIDEPASGAEHARDPASR